MNNTVVALSTAPAHSAIAMIRLTGENAIEIAEKVFRGKSVKSLSNLRGYSAAYGEFFKDTNLLDDGVCIVYRAPKSYTGEDMAELCCHGNPLIVSELISACIDAGASPATAGEFTKRAFLNGKIDLSQAEAVSELISAESIAATRLALTRREGSLGRRVDAISSSMTTAAARLGAWSDFPEEEDVPMVTVASLKEELSIIKNALVELVEGYKTGSLIDRGISVAVVGSPNVGKSTLSNYLWESERSIVTDIAGTTRDVVEASLTLNGIALKLLDTAGIHDTDNTVEKIGVERSKKAMFQSDLVLMILDSTKKISEEQLALLEEIKDKPHVVVFNKSDLKNDEKSEGFPSGIFISATTGEGVENLKIAMIKKLELNLTQDTTLIASQRQYDCVCRAKNSLVEAIENLDFGITFDAISILLDEAISALYELTGKQVAEGVTERIFASFCVGK